MTARYKSVETKYMEERDRLLRALRQVDRPTLLKVSAAAAGAVATKGLVTPHSFQLVEIANAAVDKNWAQTGAQGNPPFTFAYISDTHLYTKKLNERSVRGALKAVEDVNALDSLGEAMFLNGRFAEAEKAFLDAYRKTPAFLQNAELWKAAHARWFSGDLAGADELMAQYMTARRRAGEGV